MPLLFTQRPRGAVTFSSSSFHLITRCCAFVPLDGSIALVCTRCTNCSDILTSGGSLTTFDPLTRTRPSLSPTAFARRKLPSSSFLAARMKPESLSFAMSSSLLLPRASSSCISWHKLVVAALLFLFLLLLLLIPAFSCLCCRQKTFRFSFPL